MILPREKMQRFVALCVFFFTVMSVAGNDRPVEHATASDSGAAVVSIFACDAKGRAVSHATAFFVSADGKLASTRHAIKDAQKIIVQLNDGRILDVAGIIAEDPLHDLVLLQMKGTGFPFLSLSAFERIHKSDAVRVVISSYTQRQEERRRGAVKTANLREKSIRGTVTAVENLADDYQWFSVRMPTRRGESGSPVLNEAGEVTGMVRAEMANAGICLAVSVDYIKQLLIAPSWASAPRTPAQLQKRDYDELFDDPDFKAGMIAIDNGRDKEATRHLELAGKHFPASGAFHVLLGGAYSRLSKWDEARGEFEKAIAIKTDNAMAWASLGLALANQGKLKEAAEACDKVSGMKSGQPDTWFDVVSTYVLLKRYSEARTYLSRLRDLKTPDANEMADRLTLVLKLAETQTGKAQP